MKKFLIGICTLITMVGLIFLGIVINLEEAVIDTMNHIMEEQVKESMVVYLKDNTTINTEEIEKGVEGIFASESIENLINQCLSRAFDILINKNTPAIDVTKEVTQLINDSQSVLKNDGITLTESQKNELLAMAKNENINKTINNAIYNFKESMSPEVQKVIDSYAFIRSKAFIYMLLGIIIISLLIIALLQKSFYRWLGELGGSCIFSGVIIGLLVPFITDFISKNLTSKNMYIISTNSFKTYGYIIIAIGIVLTIVKIIISKTLEKKVA